MFEKVLRVAVGALFVWGCGEAEPATDGAVDEEFGTIAWGRADDNAVVRPGSAEEVAVLAYVNQPLTTAAELNLFETELDSRLDRRAVASITEARTGADGAIGTADDGTIETLAELDALRWVGRAVMQQLLRLAIDGGFFSPATPCEEVLGQRPGSTVDIRTLAALIEIENSACDHFGGDLIVDLRQTVLPVHRNLKALDNVREVRGELRIGWNDMMDVLAFRSLQRVGTIDTARFKVSTATPVEFPALTEVDRLVSKDGQSRYLFDRLERADIIDVKEHPGTFPALREVTNLVVDNGVVQGFGALQSAKSIRLNARHQVLGFASLETADGIYIAPTDGELTVQAFPALREVDRFEIQGWPSNLTFTGLPALESVDRLAFPGSGARFDALTTANNINTMDHVFTGSFDVLQDVGDIYVHARHYPFPALREVTGSYVLYGDPATSSPSVLERVGGDFVAETEHSRYEALVEVGNTMRIAHRSGSWDGLNALQSVGGSAFFECFDGDVEGFSSLTQVAEVLDINVYDCALSGFESMQEVEDYLTISLWSPTSSFDALENLEASQSLTFVDRSAQPLDLLPSLTLVNGELVLERTPQSTAPSDSRMQGLNAITTINGDFRLINASAIDGLGALTAIGGQSLTLPRQMAAADRDAFLGQLQQFSGDIRFE